MPNLLPVTSRKRGRCCVCGEGRAIDCDTCGTLVCPNCRFSKHLCEGSKVLYTECKPCRYQRGVWERELDSDKQFRRWYGGRKHEPAAEHRSEAAVLRKAKRDKERMNQ